jgi:hypothetical protein
MTLSADEEIEALRADLTQLNDPSVNPPVSDAARAQAQYGTAVPLPAGIERTNWHQHTGNCLSHGRFPTTPPGSRSKTTVPIWGILYSEPGSCITAMLVPLAKSGWS